MPVWCDGKKYGSLTFVLNVGVIVWSGHVVVCSWVKHTATPQNALISLQSNQRDHDQEEAHDEQDLDERSQRSKQCVDNCSQP